MTVKTQSHLLPVQWGADKLGLAQGEGAKTTMSPGKAIRDTWYLTGIQKALKEELERCRSEGLWERRKKER